ncbi:MAG: hypothetical protein RJA22_1528 [Verrucomicrobiota bacterium]|jgi:hypothetical protein
MKTPCCLSALLAAAWLAAAAAVAAADAAPATPARRDPQAPADLRLKWPAGRPQHQRLSLTMNTETGGGPTPGPVRQDVALSMEYTLAPAGLREGGGQELEMTLGDLDMAVSSGGREVLRFDTRAAAAGGETGTATLMRGLVGVRLKCLLNASNRVERVEGWRDPLRQASASAPAAGRGAMASILTEDYFRQLADFGRMLPQRVVRPGESWTNQQEISLGPLGRVILDLAYTFKAWETRAGQDCAAVAFTGTARSGAPGAGAPSPFGRLNVEDGRISGTYWFNPQEGRMVEAALQQDLTLGVDLPALPGAPDKAPGKITSRFRQKTDLKCSVPAPR